MKTKILIVSSDEDYGVVIFEGSEFTKEQMYQKCLENGGRYTQTIDESEIEFEAREFPEVPQEFIDFMEEEKDYDQAKAKNWFIINNKEN